MTRYFKKTQSDYTLAIKLAVVEQVQRGQLTLSQARQRYGIQGSSTVQGWVRKHGRAEWSKASSVCKGPSKMSKPNEPDVQRQRIEDLERQLKEAQQKAAFFEAVVGVLKRDYGAHIGKKPVGRSSRKSSSKG